MQVRHTSIARSLGTNKVSVRLEELNSLGISYVFASRLTPISCRAHNRINDFNKLPNTYTNTIRDGLHWLFMTICKIGLQLHELQKDDEAHGIFMKLILALEKYPGLCDDRKRGALLKIAKFYQDIRDQDELEWLLGKAAQTYEISELLEAPCEWLARSLPETSERARDVLFNLWQNNLMVDAESPLAIPPIQRSAQHSNPGIASIMLARTAQDTLSSPALFNLQPLHVAATIGSTENVTNFLRAGAQVDVLDYHKHTALFLAAANGHDRCCEVLIKEGAKTDNRDCHGTTILEVAARAGHFNVVKRLIDSGADINPTLICCASSPLQAAIESCGSFDGLVLYLISKNGDVSFPRPSDGKNAIDLAEERGLCILAQTMRERAQRGKRNFFEEPELLSFNQNYLEDGLSLPQPSYQF